MSEVTFYRCEKCGNMVALIKSGGGTLACCGQPMTKLDCQLNGCSPGKTCSGDEKRGWEDQGCCGIDVASDAA